MYESNLFMTNLVLPPGAYYGRSVRAEQVAGLLLTEKVHPRGETPRHAHSYPYLCLVVAGQWTEGHEGGTRECSTQTVIYHPAGEVHWDRFTGKGGRVFAIELGEVWLDRAREATGGFQEPRVFTTGMIPWAAMRIRDESRRLDSASPLLIEGLMLEMLGTAERARSAVTAHAGPGWLTFIEEILREEFRTPPSLTSLAQMVGIHPVHMARTFRARHGYSVAEYVARVRVEHAARLIAQTNRGLTDIAAEVGFFDQSHLTRTFHRIMGTTPARYRAAIKTERTGLSATRAGRCRGACPPAV